MPNLIKKECRIIIDGIVFSLQRHGGISVYFQQLLSYLIKRQENINLILQGSLLQDVEITNNKSIVRVAARLFERYRTCRVPPFGTVFHSSYYRRPSNPDLPTVVTVHDFVYERCQRGGRQWVHTLQKNASIRAAQAVICVSESTKQDLLEFVGETVGQKIYVIHNGVSDVFCTLMLEQPAMCFVLFIGKRAGYKNFRLALEAMEFLPDLELHCVGGGALHSNELKGVSESVIKRVRHLGFVSDEALNVLYNRALCLVYPSSYEGFGIPVIEAMRAGCPVVSIDCKAVVEVGGDALTVVSDHAPRVMADAILQTRSSEREALIRKGISVAKNYSWEVCHSQTLDVYRTLC